MANQKLTDLTAATTPLAGTEQVYVVQGGASRRTTAQAIAQTAAASYATAAQGAKADTAIQPGNAALSDAREWSADTISQVEAEAGSATTRRAFTAQRVFQAIAAWWAGSSAATKLAGIQAGATANATDAQLRDRSTHTGTQAAGTITGLAAVATSGAYSDLSGRPTLGSAAATETTDYATAAQGAKADTAVQPAALSGYVQTTDSRLTTDLTYDAATREVRSSTGADVVLPLVTSTAAGLLPAPPSGAPSGRVFTDSLQWVQPTSGGGGMNGVAASLTF